MTPDVRVTRRELEALEACGVFDAPRDPEDHAIVDALRDGGESIAVPGDWHACGNGLRCALIELTNHADTLATGRHADPDVTMRKFWRADRDALSRLWDRIAAAAPSLPERAAP